MKLVSHNARLSSSYEIQILNKFLTSKGCLKKNIKPKHLEKLLKNQYPYSEFKVVIHNVFRKQIKKITEIGLFYLTVEVTSDNPLRFDAIDENINLWIVPAIPKSDDS
jgi:hypothetical protein